MKTTQRDGIVEYLKEQHVEIDVLFTKVLRAQGAAARSSAFYELRRLMAIHEAAEEEVVHPIARRVLMSVGPAIVSDRLNEERKAKVALMELELMDMTSEAFTLKLRALHSDVHWHAEREVREELSKLGEALDAAHLERMKIMVQWAERLAPTRPHPALESAAENMLLGPFAAVADRARDLFAGRR